MTRSAGSAAAQGLESGFSLGLRMRANQRDEEDRTRRQGREDELWKQSQEDRGRKLRDAEDDRALQAIELQFGALRDEGSGYIQQYGGFDKVPAEVAGPYSDRAKALASERQKRLDARWKPEVQAAADRVSRWTTGQESPEAAAPVDLFRTLAYSARRDPRDFIGAEGRPSRVSQATTDLMTGIETGNEDLTLRAANVLFEPELRAGVGDMSPHGGRIVGKQIIKLMPHPQDPTQTLPVLKVFVASGRPKTSGDVARAERVQSEPGAPPDATGYYIAPITEGRSGDPADPVKSISVERAMQYAAQMQTLSQSLTNHPVLRARLEQGATEDAKSPNPFQQAFLAAGGRLPSKQVEFKTVKPGERLVGLDPAGRVVQTIEGPGKPDAKATGLAAQIEAVQDYAEAHGISEDEAARRLQRQGLVRTPKGAGGGGGGGGGGLRAMPAPGASGEDVLKGLSEEDATVVRGLADGSIRPVDISTTKNRREHMVALAKRFDPSADFGPNGKLKDVPPTAIKAILENDTSLRRAERAFRLVGGGVARAGETQDASATGLKGYLPNQLLNRVDPKGVDARAAISDLGSLVIHDRSGAAVTAAEFPRLAPFIPSEKDDAQTVKKKLKRFIEVYKEEQAALELTYSKENDYKSIKTMGAGGQAPREGGASGSFAPAPVRVQTPDQARALPPGTRFVTPDGREFVR